MSRLAVRVAFIAGVALLGFGATGFARASVAALEDLAGGAFVASGAPALLGPIDAAGRNGWQCAPERAAQASRPDAAELPAAGSAAAGRP